MQNWLKKWFGQSAGDKQQRSAFIIADPTGQATSHSMNECRAIALCLRRKGYEAKVIGATAHPLRPDGILVPLDQCLEKWRTQKTLQRFVLFISARKLKGGIAVRPELRIFSRKQDSCCRGEDHFYSAYLTDLLRNLYDTSGLLDVFGDGSHFQFLDSCKAFIPLSALFRLLNCYPGKKAVVVKADHASGFVSALLQIQPRETIVMSVKRNATRRLPKIACVFGRVHLRRIFAQILESERPISKKQTVSNSRHVGRDKGGNINFF